MAIVVRGQDEDVEPAEAATMSRAQTDPGYAAAMTGLMHNEPSQYLMRAAERSQYEPSSAFFDYLVGNAAAYGAPLDQLPQHIDSPMTAPEQYNDLYAPRDDDGNIVPIGDKPMPELLAKTIGDQMKEKQVADSAISRFQNNHGMVANMAVSMAADMTDPLNIAANLLPVAGEEAMAARIGLTGASFLSRTAARAAAGATFGVVTQAPLAALRAGLAPGENDDYSMGDALKDTLAGSGQMAAMTAGFGTLGDLLKVALGRPTAWHLHSDTLPEAASVVTADAETNQAANRAALGQVIRNEPVEISEIFPHPPDSLTASGAFEAPPIEGTANLSGELPDFLASQPQYDRDQVARQIDPTTMTNWDEANTRYAWHSQLYNQLMTQYTAEGGNDVGRAALQDELGDLQNKIQSATKSKRAVLAQRIAEIHGLLGTEETAVKPAALEPLPPQVEQPLPQGTLTDLDAEIGRLQSRMIDAGHTARVKLAKRIGFLKDQQERLADEIGVAPQQTEEVGPERFDETTLTPRIGQSPFMQVPKRPLSLVEFLTREGGLRETPELRDIVDNPNYKPIGEAGKEVANLPGERFKKFIRTAGETTGQDETLFEPNPQDRAKGGQTRSEALKTGMSLDDALQRARDEGYMSRPAETMGGKADRAEDLYDHSDLLRQIEEDVRGNRQYSSRDTNELADYEHALGHNEEIDRLAADHGIDPKGMSLDQFYDRVSERKSIDEAAAEARHRAAHYEDAYERLAGDVAGPQYHPDMREGDIIDHPEHGPLLYEGSRSLEELERANRTEEASLSGAAAKSAEHPGRSGESAISAERGEIAAGSTRRGVGAERGAGTEGGEPRTARTGATTPRGSAGRRRGIGPTAGDVSVVRRGLVAADQRLRDLAVLRSAVYQRADAMIAERVSQEADRGIVGEIHNREPTGARHISRADRQRWQGRTSGQLAPLPFTWDTDLGGMLERAKAWRETGVAPGISNAALREAQTEVTEAASRPLAPDDPARIEAEPDKPPEWWGRKATAEGEAPAEAAKADTFTPWHAPQPSDSPKVSALLAERNYILNANDNLGRAELNQLRAIEAEVGDLRKNATEGGAGEATPAGKEPAATPAAETETPPLDPLQRLQAAYPDLDIMGMTQPEKDELVAAQNGVDQAERMRGAYEEAKDCLITAGG